jgi:predicted ribosome quality control (RQC) complex YloA/Tae2 family protein
MRDVELTQVIDTLQGLVGQASTGCWQPTRERFILGFSDGTLLLVVPRGPWARIHSVARRPKSPKNPFSFQGAIRARLLGPLTALRKHPDDRVVDLEFGDAVLHIRLTGRSGGMWLLDGDRVVAALDGPAAQLPAASTAPAAKPAARFSPSDGENWDLAARRFFEAAEARQRLTDRRTEAERALRAAIGRAVRLRDALHEDLNKASESPRLRRMADALAANLYRLRKGDVAVVQDLEDPDVEHRIELDAHRPPSASLERLYAKAKRLDRTGDQVLERLDAVEAKIVDLASQLENLPTATDEALLDVLRRLPPPKAAAEEIERLPWQVWTGPSGEVILAGRDAESNRKLTFQRARGNDFWMHLRERPGAHLVIPADKDHPPPLPVLLAAAQIALVLANVAEGASAELQYTRVKYVKAIKGSPGRVTLQDERVLHVRRDADLLSGWSRT